MRRREFLCAAAVGTLASGESESNVAALRVNGKEAAVFHYGSKWDKPFLYPIRTVSGAVLSRGFPLETVVGEQTDHAWHRGFWYGHGIVNGQDFWRELPDGKSGKLIVEGAPKLRKRGGSAAVSASMKMAPPAGKPLGTIRQAFEIEDRGSLRFIDADIAIEADAGVPLTFGDTDDGGFGFRLSDAFREDRGARLRNSSGLAGSGQMWGKPAHWVDYAAVVNGQPVGVAVFDHPSNLRHPTAWHARGYSLCAANPFASKSFSKGKGPDGSYTLPAGGKLRFRYRAVIHEGPCEPDQIEQLYQDWARRGK